MLRSRLAASMVLVGVLLMLASIGLLSSVIADWEQSNGTYRLHKMTVNVDSSIASSSSAGLKQQDAEQLKKVWGALPIAFSTSGQTIARFGDNSARCNLIGVSSDYRNFTQIRIATGTSIADISVTEHSRVAVISAKIADQLFHSEHIIGKTIEMYNTLFTVIGVFAEPDSLLAQMSGNGIGDVMIPITSLMDVRSTANITSIKLLAKPNAHIHGEQEVKDALTAIGKNPAQYRIGNDETLHTRIAQQKSLLLFLYGMIVILLIVRLIIGQLVVVRRELQNRLKMDDWPDILLSKRSLPLLKRCLYIVGMAACVVGLWPWIRFHLYIPPDAFPDEIIDLSFYLDKLRSLWQLQVTQSGYVPSPDEWLSNAAEKLSGWLFFAGLCGLLSFLPGIRLWSTTQVPLSVQLLRLLLCVPVSAVAAFALARWAGMDYLIDLRDVAVPGALFVVTVVYIHIQKGELINHVENHS